MRSDLLWPARLSLIVLPARATRMERHCFWTEAAGATVTDARETRGPTSARRPLLSQPRKTAGAGDRALVWMSAFVAAAGSISITDHCAGDTQLSGR